MFHMPAFVFLAGVTAKATQLPRRIGTYMVLLALFQTLYFFAVQVLALERTFSPIVPFWILWFLLAMCWWQMLVPIIARFPRSSIMLAILVSIASGTIESIGYDFTLSRALVFLPFYVVGASYGQVILSAAARMPVAWKIMGACMAIGAWMLLYFQEVRPRWFYGSFSYERLDVPDAQGVLIRIGLLCIASATVVIFLSLMPNKDGLLAMLGRRSLAIYVMHGFLVLAATPYLPAVLEGAGSAAAFSACLVLTALTVAIFAIPGFDKSIRGFTQLVVGLLLFPFERAKERPSARRD